MKIFTLCLYLMGFASLAQAAVLTEQEEKLKQSVSAYQKNIEPLEAWQTKVFSDEILPQFQKFLVIHAGSEPTVDGDLIKSYLKFYAPSSLQAKDPKILIFLQWENTCGPCKASEHLLRAIVRARLTRRGFQPLWVEKSELDVALSESLAKVDEKLVELMKIKEAQASFVLEWGTAHALGINSTPNPNEDPEAELTGAQVPFLAMKMGMRLGEKKFEKSKVLTEEEQLEPSHASLLNELLVDLGKNQGVSRAVAQDAAGSAAPSGTALKLIQVSGIQDFSQLIRVKTIFQNQIKNIVSVVEQKVSRGQVTLAVVARSSESELQTQIDAIRFDPQKDPGLKKEIEP